MAKIILDVRQEDKDAFQKKCYKEDVSMAHALRQFVKNACKEEEEAKK